MNAASIAALAAVGSEFFFVAALFVYGPRLEPFFTPAPMRRPPGLHISRAEAQWRTTDIKELDPPSGISSVCVWLSYGCLTSQKLR